MIPNNYIYKICWENGKQFFNLKGVFLELYLLIFYPRARDAKAVRVYLQNKNDPTNQFF